MREIDPALRNRLAEIDAHINSVDTANRTDENDNGYPERYCAFIDILGFTEIISQLDQNRLSVRQLSDLLEKVHKPKDSLRENFREADFKVQSISDAVAFSASATPDGLAYILTAIDVLVFELLQLGYFVRGAVTKGRLFHDHNMIFGQALVQAYRFESQTARYARVLVTRAVKEDAGKYAKEKDWANIFDDKIRQDEDGPFYCNTLRDLAVNAAFTAANETLGKTGLGHELHLIRDKIQERLNLATDNPAHFEKVRWFARYWNAIMPRTDDLPKIKGPGLEMYLAIE